MKKFDDGEGLRHEMEENGRLIKFLYNEDREVVAEETSNGTITRYIRGLGIISSDSEEAKTYYHYVSDEQGSITHVLSEDAEILNHYSYDAFGNIIEKTEKVENRFCYNGEMLDPVTQQYYLRARFYNPVIGRFTQEDTYYGDGLNLYQYCQANPVGYVDPSGHDCEIVQNHYKQYQEYRKQHPEANAAEAYEAVTGKDPLKKNTNYVSWMNADTYNAYYANKQNATLGAPGGAVWVMSDTDAAMCKSIGAVARDTGMAGGIKAAYLAGDLYVYGIVIEGNSVNVSKPNSSTPGVNADWNSNGRTAVNGDGFVLDTGVEEFVIDGGNKMPKGSYSFRMDDYGNIEILERW